MREEIFGAIAGFVDGILGEVMHFNGSAGIGAFSQRR